jgi:4-carboxymuconolactone decarboxylase
MGEAERPARLAPVAPPYDDDIRTLLERYMPPGAEVEPLKLFRTLALNPDLASRMRPLGSGLLGHGTLEPREREIVIHRTTALAGAEYEWGVHAVAYAHAVGLTSDELRATVEGDAGSSIWSERDRVLVRLCDELHAGARVSDALWEELARGWEPAQLVELLVLAGWYRTIAYVVNGLRVEREPWAARFEAPAGGPET